MTTWAKFNIQRNIQGILDDQVYRKPSHHLGRPFMSAYQIALEYKNRFPVDFAKIGKPLGGRNSKKKTSFPQYIARILSKVLKSRKDPGFEGGFLSNLHMKSVEYSVGGRQKMFSSAKGQQPMSIFRSTKRVTL